MSQPILDRKRFASVKRASIHLQTFLQVASRNSLPPPIPEFLLHCSAGKLKPTFVKKGAPLICIGHPDHDGRGVRYNAETGFAFPQFILSGCAFLDNGSEKQYRDRQDDQEYLY